MMDIQRAIEWQKSFKKTYNGMPKEVDEVCDFAISAFEELEQYRQIGTVKDVKNGMEELSRWHTSRINKKIKNPFAYTSTVGCFNCDHKDEYIEDLEYTVKQYEQIGTEEECRAAREKMKPKKIIKRVDGTLHDTERAYIYCPSCRSYIKELNYFTNCLSKEKFCPSCGQALDWSESEEK